MNFYCKELQEVNPLIKQNENCKLLLRQKTSVFVFSKSISLILPSESRIGSFDHALHLGRKCLSCTSPFAY